MFPSECPALDTCIVADIASCAGWQIDLIHVPLMATRNQFLTAACAVRTVRDNITACQPKDSVGDSRLWSILGEIGLESRIRSFADGLDAPLGREFGGYDMSVGEWQRIALARALYHRGSILILDEPTSAADCGAVDALGRVLRDCKGSSTTPLISHDAEVLRHTGRQFLLKSSPTTDSLAQYSSVDSDAPPLAETRVARLSSHNRKE